MSVFIMFIRELSKDISNRIPSLELQATGDNPVIAERAVVACIVLTVLVECITAAAKRTFLA